MELNETEKTIDVKTVHTPVIHTIKYKYAITFILYFCSLSYGMVAYMIGATLEDFKEALNIKETDEISDIFACLFVGYILGAVISGVLFSFVNRHLCVIILLLLMATIVTLVPHAPNRGLAYAGAGIAGFTGGGFDTAQVVWTIELWRGVSDPYMQGLQFFFAVGTGISPVTSKPFLVELETDLYTVKPNSTMNTIEIRSTQIIKTESRFQIAYAITGSFVLFGAILLIIIFCYKKYIPPQENSFGCRRPSKIELFNIIFGFLMLGPYVGMEITNMQLVSTFGQKCDQRLTPKQSADLMLTLTGAFIFGRAISIIIASKIQIHKTLIGNYMICLIANIILLIFANNSRVMLYIGFGLMGFGFSSVFPGAYSFMEKQIEITDCIGAFFICSAGIMTALVPTILGKSIDAHPLNLIYTNIALTIISCTSFVTMYFMSCVKNKAYQLPFPRKSI